jgi:cyclic pyranopterin phosphate synthase
MHTGLPGIERDFYLSCLKAKQACQSLGELIPVESGLSATAEVLAIKGFCGTIGFISPISRPFCSSCNKLRLTSDGLLKSCLHSPKSVNLKEALRKGMDGEALAELIREAVSLKPASHNLLNESVSYAAEDFSMCQIGG